MTGLEITMNVGNVQNIIGVMIPIVAIVGGLSLAFAIRYLKSKERMEMISRGMDVSAFKELDLAEAMGKKERRNPLRQGFIALGVGAGVLVSYALCHTIFRGDDNEIIYLGVVALFVGAAIIASHMMDKKEPEQEQK